MECGKIPRAVPPPDRASIVLSDAPAVCFAFFSETSRLADWVPGLVKAAVLTRDGEGRAIDVKCDYADKRTYFLRYAYDPAALRVTFRTVLGDREGVAGGAEFLPHEEGCEIRYELRHGDGRTEAELREGSGDAVLQAFAAFLDRLKRA